MKKPSMIRLFYYINPFIFGFTLGMGINSIPAWVNPNNDDLYGLWQVLFFVGLGLHAIYAVIILIYERRTGKRFPFGGYSMPPVPQRKPQKPLLKLLPKFGPMQRSYNSGDNITDDEWKYLSELKCPDCEKHWQLWEGPSGGASTNYACLGSDKTDGCESRFNLMVGGYVGAGFLGTGGGGFVNWGQRISDSSLKQKQPTTDGEIITN